jgi:hypothetical protein
VIDSGTLVKAGYDDEAGHVVLQFPVHALRSVTDAAGEASAGITLGPEFKLAARQSSRRRPWQPTTGRELHRLELPVHRALVDGFAGAAVNAAPALPLGHSGGLAGADGASLAAAFGCTDALARSAG